MKFPESGMFYTSEKVAFLELPWQQLGTSKTVQDGFERASVLQHDVEASSEAFWDGIPDGNLVSWDGKRVGASYS